MQTKTHPELITAHCARDIASLINHIKVPSFMPVLEEVLSNHCNFDTILVVTYKKSFKPIILHPKDPAEHSPTLKAYIDKAYILDPLFNSIQNGPGANVSRLVDIALDSFDQTEYYQSCYRKFDLVDEVNMTIPLSQHTTCAIALGRKSALGTITRAELNRLKSIFPVIEALIQQFWQAQSGEFVKYEKSEGPLKQALKTFASGVLTQREQEILGLILQGHSSKAIADLLSISVGTVKVHRKNIHSRLNTSTQSEIFTLFLSHLNSLENG
ncbi:LuxR C-terminal-related transcriptional regulator [Oceanospirillum linum]|uniref:Helix-turn-helix transcriptional regulator n=1 Tax=Oceanospirillum linum TaxID=966 RepID=A0A1T1HDF4_OCELI|nr:LuxR C-terminal-related transcriptional regulator [Oceanospirillum linum]OOV87884.1 helix-turn-helix transcriptional regulator [Oceanospirillum linum]SEG09068.1 regulatory protein, luxR family [Oleiphilus messinensis]SMP08491.1 transcriptional regulator, LuxR family [Oceanospirillum linum]